MLEPPGAANVEVSAWTLTRKALPVIRFAFEMLILVEFGLPAVLRLTSVTAKLTTAGTATATDSWASDDGTLATNAGTLSITIRRPTDRAVRRLFIVLAHA